jgi:multidrug resistance protein, MATE family
MRFRTEIRQMFRLAWPLAVAEMGWMLMNFVDLAMIGRVGPSAMAAIAIGNALFITFGIIASGSLLSLDALVSQAFGAGRIEDCHRYLWSALAYCVPTSAVLIAIYYFIGPLLYRFGYAQEVVAQVTTYLRALGWGIPPLMGYFAMRRYLQGIHLVGIIPFALISANLVNAACNYVFIYGHFGVPALGAQGSGLSTSVARYYMFAVLAFYISYKSRQRSYRVLNYVRSFFDWPRISEVVRLGAPAAAQIALEVGVFSGSTLMAGRLGAEAVAAHQIALEMASFTFMAPLGISAATAVRVGHAIGRRDLPAATLAGWTGGALSLVWMTFTALCFWLIPHQLVSIFTVDPGITRLAVSLLSIAAIFQLFDGLQVVMIGALRGTADTRTAMYLNILGWWIVSLPISILLCFHYGQGVYGIWIGLCIGDILIAVLLGFAWHHRMVRLTREGISDQIAQAAEASAHE